MQEQAINTFNEGLVMDLNPLTTPNNVLTNCLNGTFITYDGNEFVLQNDDGNGRVETAYLPSGYVPVGIKEYGGVIYIASYNPIDGKGQVGSFPSPERNIESTEIGDAKKDLTYLDFLDSDSNVSKFSITKEIIEDSILRPGDKFFIAIESGESGEVTKKQLVDKLYNLLTGLGKDGKGNPYSDIDNPLTLSICIRTSDRALLDITPKLKRITQEGTGKDIYYYLEVCSNKSDGGIEGSRWDEDLMNIYNSKMTGTLCLVASLPTIDSSSVSNIGKIKIDSNTNTPIGSRVKFKSVYTYSEQNCPRYFGGSKIKLTYTPLEATTADSINLSVSLDNDDKYVISDLIKLRRDGETFSATIDTVSLQQEISSYIASHPGAPEFSIRTDEAKSNRIIETLPFMSSDLVSGTLDYEVLPFMKFPYTNNLGSGEYLGYMSVYKKSGSIDISKLGSGEFEITGWKFYNDFFNGYAKIYIDLLAYPSEDLQFLSVKFSFYKNNNESLKDPYIHMLYNDGMFNGGFEFNVPYGDKFEMKDVALCKISVSIQTYDVGTSAYIPGLYDFGSSKRDKYYVLTTTMFNETYVNGWATTEDIQKMEERKLKYPTIAWSPIDPKFFDTYVQEELKYSISTTMLTDTTDPKSIKNPEKKLLDSPDAEYESTYEYDVSYVYDVDSVQIISPEKYAVELESYTLESISDSELSTGDGYEIKDLSLKNKKNINFKIHNTIPIFGQASNETVKLFGTPLRYYTDRILGVDAKFRLINAYSLEVSANMYDTSDQIVGVRRSIVDRNNIITTSYLSIKKQDQRNGEYPIGVNTDSTSPSNEFTRGMNLKSIFSDYLEVSPECRIIPLYNFYHTGEREKINNIKRPREEGPVTILNTPFNALSTGGNVDYWGTINGNYYNTSVTLVYVNPTGNLVLIDSIYQVEKVDVDTLGTIDGRSGFSVKEALGYFYNVGLVQTSNKVGYKIINTEATYYNYKYSVLITAKLNTHLTNDIGVLTGCNIINTLDTKQGQVELSQSIVQKNISNVLSGLESYSSSGIRTYPENLILRENTIYYMDDDGALSEADTVENFSALVKQLTVSSGEISIAAPNGGEVNGNAIHDKEGAKTMYFAEHKYKDVHRRIALVFGHGGADSRTVKLNLSNKHINASV